MNVIATPRRRFAARTVVVLGSLLAGVAIAVILCRRGERPESLAADGESHAAANGPAAVETASAPAQTPTPTIARELVAPAATGGSRTVLRGTVRLAETGTPVRRGALFAEYVDCVAAGVAPETLVGRDPEQLNEHRADRRAQLTATGDYELELPGPILLIRIAIEPPKGAELAGSREQVCFGGFLPLDVPIGEAITAPVWQRDFEVGAGGRLIGFTVEAGSGVPVPGALVRTARVYMPFDQQGAHSDARGAFAITGLPAEPTFPDAKLKVRVSCTGFLDRELLVQPAVNGPTEVLVELERAVIVSGRVVDPEGHGVAGATVDAVAFAGGPTPFGQPLALLQSMQTVDDGSFTFSLPPVARLCLRAEGSYRVSAKSEQWTSGVGRLAGLESLRDRQDLRLELRSQASFRVRATWPDGTVVPQGEVVVLVEDDEGWRRFGAFFTASAAVEHTIRVLAPPPGAIDRMRAFKGPGQPEDRRAFRGSATCLSTRTDGRCTEIAVALEPWQPDGPPALPPETSGEKVMFGSADVPGAHACFVRDLTFLDDATGELLADRGYSVSIGLSSLGGQTSSRGRVRLAVGSGTIDLTVRVDGCQPQAFRIANPATGYAAIDVRLRPVPAERR